MTHEIFNPWTGQRMTFTEISPELLVIETVNPATDAREPLHVHPRQVSGGEIRSGSLVFEVDGVERRLGPGESIEIPAGTPHRFWNDGTDDAHAVQFFRPALDSVAFFETLFALARDGALDAKGMPKPLQLALMVPEFSEEIRPVSPPWPVLRAASMLLGPLARRLGYRARVAM
jgi:quercetin dioxygenase-like cupin family protein